MKLTGYFGVLLSETVNLGQSKLDTLDEHVEAIYKALKADPVLGPYIIEKIPPGSWAHRTSIKPLPGFELDRDILLRLRENPDWPGGPKKYIDKVYEALDNHGIYGGKPHTRKCRCVRLTYADGCHVDIVPYLILADG